MKKYLFTLLLAAVCGMASAQEKTPSLKISDISIIPGGTASFTLVVNVGDLAVKGFQYEKLTLPEGLSVTKQTTASLDGGSLAVNNTKGLYTNSKGLFIPTNEDIEIATIELQAAADMAMGPVTVTFPAGDVNFLDGTNYFPVEDEVSFTVEVTDAVVLNENSTKAPVAAEGVKVLVKRTINANEWSTICLPFAMNAEQMAKAFGSDVKLANFTGYEPEYDAKEENVIGITVNFENVTELEANHPYIIKVSSAVSEFSVEGVDITPEEEPTVAAVKRTKKQWSEMIGTYTKKTLDPMLIFLSENKFWYSAGATTIMAFRGYFDFYDAIKEVEDEYAASRIKMSFDDTATGINGVNINVDGEYYNLNGLRVETPAKGIFIKDGKKVVVK